VEQTRSRHLDRLSMEQETRSRHLDRLSMEQETRMTQMGASTGRLVALRHEKEAGPRRRKARNTRPARRPRLRASALRSRTNCASARGDRSSARLKGKRGQGRRAGGGCAQCWTSALDAGILCRAMTFPLERIWALLPPEL
jgi:hypothetical protein